MSGLCPDPSVDAGLIRGLMGAVDCNVRAYSQAGYQALVAPTSLFPAALSLLLVIYVAVLGHRMLFGLGNLRLGDLPVIGVRLGVVLAVGLGWSAFQTVVFDLAMDAPLQVARVVGEPAARSGSALAARPLDGLQSAYDQLVADAAAFGKAAGPNAQALQGGPARASEGLWRASAALFLTTAGLLVLAQVATGVLSAIGPIFIALFLFDATRGLFSGWVRALAAAALAPLVCWIGAELLLIVLDPWLTRLAAERAANALNPDTANAAVAVVFAFAAAQVALLAAGSAIAAGFGQGGDRRSPADKPAAAPTPEAATLVAASRAQLLARRLETETLRAAPAAYAAAAPGRDVSRLQLRGASGAGAWIGAAEGPAAARRTARPVRGAARP